MSSRTRGYASVFSRLRRSAAGHLPDAGELSVERITREEFLAQTGCEPEQLRDMRVLDAGCGGGRFMTLLAAHGVHVVGVDLDATGLRQAGEHVIGAHLVQGDLFQPPFRPASFDFVYSLGVLHHTPDPPAAFRALVPLLKPGGRIAIWTYPKRETTPISNALRPFTTRLPYSALQVVAWIVALATAPMLISGRLRPRVQSWLYWARLPWQRDARWRVHSFIDWYGPRHQFKYATEDLVGWCRENGLVEVRRGRYESSVCARRAGDAPSVASTRRYTSS